MIYYLFTTYFVNSHKRSPGSIRILNYLTSPVPGQLFRITNHQIKNIYGSTTLVLMKNGTWPSTIMLGLMRRKASMTTLPLTDWMGSTTTATARSDSASKLCWVLMSTPNTHTPCEKQCWGSMTFWCRSESVSVTKMDPDPTPFYVQ
jgi:hypothetical protein